MSMEFVLVGASVVDDAHELPLRKEMILKGNMDDLRLIIKELKLEIKFDSVLSNYFILKETKKEDPILCEILEIKDSMLKRKLWVHLVRTAKRNELADSWVQEESIETLRCLFRFEEDKFSYRKVDNEILFKTAIKLIDDNEKEATSGPLVNELLAFKKKLYDKENDPRGIILTETNDAVPVKFCHVPSKNSLKDHGGV